MNTYLENIKKLLQDSDLPDKEKQSLLNAVANADKQWGITDFKLDRTEKVKHTTAILLEETIEELEQKRKAVERQNRELEIESALERVRTVSMSMKVPADMLSVCKTIADQLALLAVKDIRNVQTAIFYEGKGTYMNYEYYARHDKTFITETSYTNNKIHQAFADQMMKGNGGLFITHIKGDEVKDWIAYQKTTNVFIDDYLDKASSLNYYWYSLGSVALGISTYEPLQEEQAELFKRFLKVFELSYKRYLDIEQAESQAKEARIEAALERVRSRSMGMQKSDELKEVIQIVHDQLIHLNINVDHAGFVVDYIPKGDWHFWIADKNEIPSKITHPYFESVWANQFDEAKEKGTDFFATNLNFEEKNKFYEDLLSFVPGLPEESKNFYLSCPGLGASTVLLDNVGLYIENFDGIPYSDGDNKTLMRFGKVFQQTYTRFLDLQKAEAQARESQIQLALERARVQSMMMQHSKELDDTLLVFHEQVLKLNIPSAFSFLWLPDEEKDKHLFWAAWAENNSFKSKAINYPLDRNEPATKQCLVDWKGNEPVVAYHVPPDGVANYFAAWSELIAGVDELQPQYFSDGLYYVEAFMKYGCFGVMVKNPLAEDQKKTLERLATEFERAYTRFLDLQKAEAQARESQIQLALERVRARTMAMQQSHELPDAANILFQQVESLGMPAWSAGYCTWEDDKKAITLWMSSAGIIQQPFRAPLTEDTSFIHFFEAYQRGETFYVEETGGDELVSHYKYMCKLPVVGDMLNKFVEEGGSLPVFQIFHLAFFSQGFLLFITYEPVPEAHDIFKRFGKVFEQTYTRFLDLQKAEGQAREAQIEAALEKVRSRSLAMHRSDELREVVSIVCEKLQALGFELQDSAAAIIIFTEGSKDIIQWISEPGRAYAIFFKLPYIDNPLIFDIFKAKENGKDFFFKLYPFEVKNEYFNFLFEQSDYKYLPNEIKELMLGSKKYGFSVAFEKNSAILIPTSSGKLLSESQAEILKRFAKVFEQSYVRFLDLQKAESQTRESQIELSLERVRSKTMAMHNSTDVGETAAVMVGELKKLGIETIRCGIGIMHEPGDMELWTIKTDENNKTDIIIGWMDMNIHPLLHGAFESWRNKIETYAYELKDEDLLNYYNAINNYPGYPIRYDTSALPKQIHHNEFHFTEGTLFAFSLQQLTDEQRKILKRFANVFGQTYRRYLDLKRAEAQARQAKIEAAMEKVRSRAMAMQKPAELVEVAQLLRGEMGLLGVEELETSSIYIHDEATQKTECWYAIKDVQHPDKELVSDHMTIDLHETSVGKQMLQFYKSNKNQISIPMQGNARKEWINYCADHSKVLVGFYGDNIPDRTYHLYKFSNGYMGAASPGDISAESWDLLQRATSVFSLAYTRFSDLQQAEAQAREANIEAALERVRSRTLAMQKSDELAETAAVVFRQLIGLGIAPNRLYIGIVKGETGDMEMWATDEDGTHLGKKFMFNKNENISVKKLFDGWKAKEKSVIVDMQGKELEDYFHYLNNVMHIPFKGGLTQKRRVQSVAYFSKGFIGMASPDGQGDETIQLLERFAAVFNLTFTRFNDLKIAEAHAVQAEEDLIKLQTEKKRAEDALTELRSTQTQLIQSEKMASLGELTAGIAHEIQNPLNFVNNFSEVSKELLDEMSAAFEKGDMEDAKEIMNDVIRNLEKINHHGKRADGIVKGMLQHSRTSSGQKELTDINALSDEYLRLAYHGLRAKDKSFNAKFETDFDASIGKIEVMPQDIARVVLNLINNAFYAVSERKKAGENSYEPVVMVSTKRGNGIIEIRVKDNGTGIPQKVLDKIFQPFFTTKPTGQGTGLGLSLSYDIVTKGHGGELKVETKEGEGSIFIIQLPQ